MSISGNLKEDFDSRIEKVLERFEPYKITGNLKEDSYHIDELNIEQIKEILRPYNEYNYSLVLTDFEIRSHDYKNKLLFWTIENALFIPRKYRYEFIESLLKCGADINFSKEEKYEWYKYTPLVAAMDRGDVDLVKFLIQHGANKDENDYQLIRIASQKNYIEFMKFFLGFDLLPQMLNDTLNDSILCGNFNVAELLLNRGADINSKEVEALETLAEGTDSGIMDIIEFYLINGGNPNNKNRQSLLSAIFEGDKDLVELLIKFGVDISSPIKFSDMNTSETPLEIASRCGYSEISDLILKEIEKIERNEISSVN